MKVTSLITTIFLISGTVSALGAGASVTLISSVSGVGSSASVTLTATVSGITTIGQVAFYEGTSPNGILIGSSTTPSSPGVYTIVWIPGPGTYSVYASIYGVNGALSPAGINSAVIDTVGSPSVSSNPATNSLFGEQKFSGQGNTAWVEGDDQVCSTTSPYNGANLTYLDGSCEWMNAGNVNGVTGGGSCATGTCSTSGTCTDGSECTAVVPTSAQITGSSIDGLDDAMHTMSDFVRYANSLLNLGVGGLNSTLNTWAPQAAEWMGPGCGQPGATSTSACTKTEFDENLCDNSTPSGSIKFCNSSGDNGRLLSIYNPYTGLDLFNSWNQNVITPWLISNYTNPSAWCVPSEGVLLNGNKSTAEDTYINGNNSPTTLCTDHSTCGAIIAGQCQNGNACSTWGDMPHVISCLNYNGAASSAGFGPAYQYQQCLNLLTSQCPSTLVTNPISACDPSLLGRSLISSVPPAYSGANKCNPGAVGSFANYVSDSSALFNDEAPKFALRSLYLSDVYTRAQNMQTAFSSAHQALGNFFKTCAGCGDGSTCSSGQCQDGSACGSPLGKCEDGGPVAQLQFASESNPSTLNLPNAVIYGWVDNKYPNGVPGYAHIVKVTAYSPGRQGANSANATFILNRLPWIKTWETFFLRIYELTERDGYVYVSVKRWDQEHPTSVNFPNNHALWQFLFSPNISGTSTTSTGGLIPQCINPSTGYGWGLVPETVTALKQFMIPTSGGVTAAVTNDQTSLANAFMLNDRGDGTGTVDPTLSPGAGGSNSTYGDCLKKANELLGLGIESHACARYIASRDAGDVKSGSSGNGAGDYSIKFVECSTISGYNVGPPDDLLYQGS